MLKDETIPDGCSVLCIKICKYIHLDFDTKQTSVFLPAY